MTPEPTVSTNINMDPLSTEDGLDAGWLDEAIEYMAEHPITVPPRYVDAEPAQVATQQWISLLLGGVKKKYAGTGNLPKFGTGPSLLLAGPTGTGKTHEAYAALQKLAYSLARGTIVFTTMADLYARLRPSSGLDVEREISRFMKASVLILDDLGSAKASEWTEEVDYRILNHRYEYVLPTLITTNVPPPQMEAVYGERLESRLREMCKLVVIKGTDRRKA